MTIDETKIPKELKNITTSFFGANGGSLDNPIWLCGLEWGGGYSEEEYLVPENLQGDSVTSITVEELKAFLVKRGRSFFRSQIALLHAITANSEDRKHVRARACIDDGFHFFCKDNYGVSLNAYPISMKARSTSQVDWERKVVQLQKNSVPLSLRDWTSFDTFDDYKTWCTLQRASVFSNARLQYSPAIVYCGGIGEKRNFYRIWANQDYKEPEGTINFSEKCSPAEYWWLDNGQGRQETLLVIGPFFVNRYGLNSYEKCWNLGRSLRNICFERFKDNGAWLQEDLYMPRKLKKM